MAQQDKEFIDASEARRRSTSLTEKDNENWKLVTQAISDQINEGKLMATVGFITEHNISRLTQKGYKVESADFRFSGFLISW